MTARQKGDDAVELGKEVRFRIMDVYLPDPRDLLSELCGAESLRGRVVDVSDSGMKKGAFAVIEVPGLSRPVIVPLECIESEPRDGDAS